MNVLNLTLSFAPGGRRVVITYLLQGLEPYGIRPFLCCLNEFGCPPEEVEQVTKEACVLNRRSLIDSRALGKLRAYCLQNSIQIIHTHDAASQFTAALLRLRMPGLRLLMTFHRSLDFESATIGDRVRNAFAGVMSQAVVTLSRERRAHYLERNLIDARKVVLIPNGVDIQRFHPDAQNRSAVRRELGLDDETIVFGTVGHFGLEKGVDVVLQAWKVLLERPHSQRSVLVIVGTGSEPDQERMRRLAASCPAQSVIFTGFRADPERFHQAFDVYAHAPRTDACPLAVVEAMASGLPIVGTAVGGLKDLVVPGRNGLLAPAESASQLADAMERMFDVGTREFMGEQSLRRVMGGYTLDRNLQDYARLYGDLLERKPLTLNTVT
jgi:glycosyltransferase involved in cell wall biosynthesis